MRAARVVAMPTMHSAKYIWEFMSASVYVAKQAATREQVHTAVERCISDAARCLYQRQELVYISIGIVIKIFEL